MRVFHVIILCITCMVAGCVGTSIFFLRQDRDQHSRITELERIVNQQQQEFTNTVTRLSDNNRRTRELAQTMAEQLARDCETISNTRDLINLLRKQIKVLENIYTYCNSDIDSSNGCDSGDF